MQRLLLVPQNTENSYSLFASHGEIFEVKTHTSAHFFTPRSLWNDKEIAAIIVEDKKIKNDEVEYTIISTEHEKKQRNKILDTAAKIKSFIKKEFTSGHQVSVNNVLQKFKNEEITNACVCMHLKSVREELMAAGVEIEKIKHGVYQNKIFIN